MAVKCLAPLMFLLSHTSARVDIKSTLKEAVLVGYNPISRPVEDTTTDQRVLVGVGLRFKALQNVDAVESKLVTAGTLYLKWEDPELTWNAPGCTPSGTGTDDDMITDALGKCAPTINSIQISPTGGEIWIPDIEIQNIVSKGSIDPLLTDAMVTVTSDGTVYYSSLILMETACRWVLDEFPFDAPICPINISVADTMKTGVLVYPDPKLNTEECSCDTDECFEEGQKKFENCFEQQHPEFGVERIEYLIAGGGGLSQTSTVYKDPDSTSQVDIVISMQRLSANQGILSYYIIYSVFPVLCATLCGLLAFMLPPRIGERIGMGATCMLTVIAIMFVTSSKLPVQKTTTFLDEFYLLCIIFNLAILLESAFVCWLSDTRGNASSVTHEKRYHFGLTMDILSGIVFPIVFLGFMISMAQRMQGKRWDEVENYQMDQPDPEVLLESITDA